MAGEHKAEREGVKHQQWVKTLCRAGISSRYPMLKEKKLNLEVVVLCYTASRLHSRVRLSGRVT